jgi:hypothetical protein
MNGFFNVLFVVVGTVMIDYVKYGSLCIYMLYYIIGL